MEYPTPRLQQLSFQLTILLSDLNRQVTALQQRLGALPPPEQEKYTKQRHSKAWKITLKDILSNSTESDGE